MDRRNGRVGGYEYLQHNGNIPSQLLCNTHSLTYGGDNVLMERISSFLHTFTIDGIHGILDYIMVKRQIE